jgi:hypothetical protein
MLRTKSGLPKYCSWNTDHHGKRRVRFRKAGFTTYLSGTPWSEDFMRQYAAALEGVKAHHAEIGVGRTKPGSLDELVESRQALELQLRAEDEQKLSNLETRLDKKAAKP